MLSLLQIQEQPEVTARDNCTLHFKGVVALDRERKSDDSSVAKFYAAIAGARNKMEVDEGKQSVPRFQEQLDRTMIVEIDGVGCATPKNGNAIVRMIGRRACPPLGSDATLLEKLPEFWRIVDQKNDVEVPMLPKRAPLDEIDGDASRDVPFDTTSGHESGKGGKGSQGLLDLGQIGATHLPMSVGRVLQDMHQRCPCAGMGDQSVLRSEIDQDLVVANLLV